MKRFNYHLTVFTLLAAIGATAFAAAGFDRLKDHVKIGQGTATDKVIELDIGQGTSNPKITVKNTGEVYYQGTSRSGSVPEGSIGQVVSDDAPNDVTGTCGSFTSVASITLGPGIWSLSGVCVLNSGGSEITRVDAALDTSTPVYATDAPSGRVNTILVPSGDVAGGLLAVQVMPHRTVDRLEGTTTWNLYCRALCTTQGTWDETSNIRAYRIR